MFAATVPWQAWALTRVDSLRYQPTGKLPKTTLVYRYTYYASTQDEGGVYHNFGQARHRFESRVPLSDRTDRSITFTPRLKYFNTRTDGVLTGLPGDTALISPEYYDVGMTFEYLQQSSSKGTFGFLFDAGTASDKPFKPDTISFDTTLFMRPGTGTGAGRMIYFVDWSNNRMILKGLPFPGFAYVSDPSPDLTLMVGFPVLALDARASKEWSARARFFLGKSLTIDALYTLSNSEALRFGFEWDIDVFLKNGRADPGQRVVMMERRLSFDLLATVLPQFQVRVGGGYVSGRKIFEGTSLLSTPARDIEIQPTVFGAISGVLEL